MCIQYIPRNMHTVFALLWLYIDWFSHIHQAYFTLQSDDCPSASKATLMNMYKYFMWIHYERLHKHNKAKHNKTVCIFLGIYCTLPRATVFECMDKVSHKNTEQTLFLPWTRYLRQYIQMALSCTSTSHVGILINTLRFWSRGLDHW